MGKIKTEQIQNSKIWEKFLAEHTEANFSQSFIWGEFQSSLGRKIFRSVFFKNDELVGVMFSYIEVSKRGKYLVVPGGPIIDWKDEELKKKFVEEIKRICSENSCIFARVRPQLENNELSLKEFKKLGLRKSPMYLHAELTSQINLVQDEEVLLSNMRKNTRYEVKKAINLNIKLEKNGDENIKSFYKLQLETSKRQKFVPFSEKFLLNQFEILLKEDKAILYTAKFNGEILAQAFVIFYGKEAVYHYGASTEAGRKYPGAYLLQWEAIREAKKRNMLRYNLWGVAPDNEKAHRFYGISIFKRGFGGIDVSYLPAHDFIVKKPAYLVNYLFEAARRKLRRS